MLLFLGPAVGQLVVRGEGVHFRSFGASSRAQPREQLMNEQLTHSIAAFLWCAAQILL
jgi:hypothetical protein